ncbi:MAG: response regulator [Anaerolineales bacterium]|jgi:putative two-component system response regulator
MNNEKILVVEDNETLRNGIKTLLEEAGYEVNGAENGEDALQTMGLNPPDLIIADIVMPIMDGYEFFEIVRSQSEWLSIPFIFLTALREREDVFTGKQLGADDYLIKPISRAELITTVRSRLNRKQQLLYAQMQQSYESILMMLADAVESRDKSTPGRSKRVMDYAQVIAQQIGWTVSQRSMLRFGAILHDIGKIFIREDTLRKMGDLDVEEWDEVKEHPDMGAEILKDIPYLAPAIPIIRHHHERWDGQGYPDQLAGKSIPLGARIVAVADAFDAMTTERVYQAALTNQQAYDEIVRCSGSAYDPAIVSAFKKAWHAGLIQEIFSRDRGD